MSSAEENNQQVYLEPLSVVDEPETADSTDDDSDVSSQSSSELVQLDCNQATGFKSTSIDMNNYYGATTTTSGPLGLDGWQYSYGPVPTNPPPAPSFYHQPDKSCYNSYYSSPSFSNFHNSNYSTNHDSYNQYASSSFSFNSQPATPPPMAPFNLPLSSEHQQPLSVQTYSPPPTCGLQAPHQSTPSLITTISAVNSAAYNPNPYSYVNPPPAALKDQQPAMRYDSYNTFPTPPTQNALYTYPNRSYFGMTSF